MTTITIDRAVVEQALETIEDLTRDRLFSAEWAGKHGATITALRAALAQQEEPMQEQVIEDAIEAAYWHFDARKKGLNEWASAPQSERDAFKAEARKLVRGYFPTRQAQDTKREMLAVADAFIRGKRAALAQQDAPNAHGYASRLAFAIWNKHYKDIAPQWKPLDDLMGVLTQIDNMTSGLTLLALAPQVCRGED